jgi:hypothetical protein
MPYLGEEEGYTAEKVALMAEKEMRDARLS